MKRERNDHPEQLGQSCTRDLGLERNLRPCYWNLWIQAGKERASNFNRIGVKKKSDLTTQDVTTCISSLLYPSTREWNIGHMLTCYKTHLSAVCPSLVWWDVFLSFFFSVLPISPQRPSAKNTLRLNLQRGLSKLQLSKSDRIKKPPCEATVPLLGGPCSICAHAETLHTLLTL